MIIFAYGSYNSRGKIKNRVYIDASPRIFETRTRIGDWEGDTVIVKLTGKHADLLVQAAVAHMQPYQDLVHTITFDNGLEFAAHEQIAKGLKTDIYFAHPYASWERGTNENTNGLIRQYFPKGTDFNKVTDEEIVFVMNRLNDATACQSWCKITMRIV